MRIAEAHNCEKIEHTKRKNPVCIAKQKTIDFSCPRPHPKPLNYSIGISPSISGELSGCAALGPTT